MFVGRAHRRPRRRVSGWLGGRFPRMANWPPEVAWHERDVVVPVFRLWLEDQGWETETETAFVDVVARRGNETIYAEVKGRTKSRPGAGLDTLYGQLLRRMPAGEVDDPDTRFAVVIPSGLEAAALRVPRRVRERLRIDIYAVSDDGQVEKLSDSEALEVEREDERLAGETVAPSRPQEGRQIGLEVVAGRGEARVPAEQNHDPGSRPHGRAAPAGREARRFPAADLRLMPRTPAVGLAALPAISMAGMSGSSQLPPSSKDSMDQPRTSA